MAKGINIKGEALKNAVFTSGLTIVRAAKIMGKTDRWLTQAVQNNRMGEVSFYQLCALCELNPGDFIDETSPKAKEPHPSDHFKKYSSWMNDLGAIQAETLKVLNDMRMMQARMCEEMNLIAQTMTENKAAIQQLAAIK